MELVVLFGVVLAMALVVGACLLVVAKTRPASHLLLWHDCGAEELILLLAAPEGRRVDVTFVAVLESDLDGVGDLLCVNVSALLCGR
jgi:hypothetical protein